MTQKNDQKNPSNIITADRVSARTKQEIDKEYYEKNKERKKQQRKERYAKEKKKEKTAIKKVRGKYYGAEAYKVLMGFKEWTELNKDKQKLWTDFCWTLKDCREEPSTAAVMKLELVAGNLVRDYWQTARAEERKGKSWNSLSEKQQQRLIKFWGQEKARVENGYVSEWERLEKEGEQYEKEIEMVKFHEERGKVECDCWQCLEKQKIHKEIQAVAKERLKKDMDDYDRERGSIDKEECPHCGKFVKELDEENGLCKECLAEYE